jgi:hypothetical protein
MQWLAGSNQASPVAGCVTGAQSFTCQRLGSVLADVVAAHIQLAQGAVVFDGGRNLGRRGEGMSRQVKTPACAEQKAATRASPTNKHTDRNTH